MALIKCEECGKEISDKAKTCINCGYPVGEIKAREENENKKAFETLNKEERNIVYQKYRRETNGKSLGLTLGLIGLIIFLTLILPVGICFFCIICLTITILVWDKREVKKFYEDNNFNFNNKKE